MSPISTNANLFRLLILPSGECSRAGMMYHSLIARRSELTVVDSRFGRCSPISWLSMSSTCTLMRVHVLLPTAAVLFSRLRSVAIDHPRKRHQVEALHPGCSGPIHTKAPGGVGLRQLWSLLSCARPGCEDAGPGLLPPIRPVSGVGLCS